jgi:ABC-type transporter Mla subunit MlaD
MRRFGIVGKIWLSIGVSVAGMLTSLAVSQMESVRAEARLRLTSERLFPAAQSGQQAEAAFERMEKGFRDGVLLEEAAALAQGERDGLVAASALNTAAGLQALDPPLAGLLTALASDVSTLAHDARAGYDPMVKSAGTLTPGMAETSRQLAERTATIRKAVAAASEQLAADLRGELAQAVRASAAQRWYSLLAFCAALAVCGIVVAYTIRHAIVGPIRRAIVELTQTASQVATSSSQVAASSQSLSQGASQQAVSLEDTSASMDEMASMTRRNAENSQAVAALMSEVDARVKASNQSLGDMVTAMASIQESSHRVAKIIKTIDEIAFQTNILALNAAVEAARAGEAGMGFAVVADEVRNLAQRSAQAAKDTADLIEASLGKAQDGNRKVEQATASIAGIIGGLASVKRLVDEVSTASRQQTQGIDQVSRAVAKMETVTQATAALAEESAAASEELRAQAEASMSVICRLDALVRSTGESVVEKSRPTMGRVAQRAVPVAIARRRPPSSTADELPMRDTGTYGAS